MSEQSILMMMTTIVLLSGGVDSTACAHYMLKRNHRVTPLFVDYGQRAAIPEHRAASGICDALGLTLQCVKSITGRSFGVGEITGRNAFLIMAATMSAVYNEPCQIALGIHSGTSYYDCSPAFLGTVNRLLLEQSDGRARAVAPFLTWSKGDVFSYFEDNGLPWALVYSCEAGKMPPCGECGSCRGRMRIG